MTRATLFLVCFLLACPVPLMAGGVTIFAASSLRGALDDIIAGIDATAANVGASDAAGEAGAETPVPARLSFGGSGVMARQIAQGAPADVVILAHAAWMEWLAGQGLLAADPVVIAQNRLVLIGTQNPPAIGGPLVNPTAADLVAALKGGRLAIGQRDAVPAGQYAQSWLKHIKAWDALVPHLAETDNVRAALALVARGDTPLGVVYASDAQAEPRVTVLWDIPANSHAPITLWAAALTPAGLGYLPALTAPDAQAIFARHGFVPVAGTEH